MKAIDKAIKLCDAAITGKGINAFVSALAKKGYEIDSADIRDPKGVHYSSERRQRIHCGSY